MSQVCSHPCIQYLSPGVCGIQRLVFLKKNPSLLAGLTGVNVTLFPNYSAYQEKHIIYMNRFQSLGAGL